MSEASERSTDAVAGSNKNNIIILITTSRAERSFYVTQMRANFSTEGMEPSSDDLAMQQGFVDGTVSLAGMHGTCRRLCQVHPQRWDALSWVLRPFLR